MPTPAAAEAAAAGLPSTVEGPRATVTLPSRGGGTAKPEPYSVPWMALARVGRSLPADVRVIVFNGGENGFAIDPAAPYASQGDGFTDTEAADTATTERLLAAVQAGVGWLARPDLVSVAAVAGPASGPGAQIALACDLRIITDDATFALPEVGRGLVPYLGGTAALVDAVGYARALEICLTGRVVGAREAVRLGIAQLAVPRAELAHTVDDLAMALLAAPRGAAAEAKALLRAAAQGRPRGEMWAAEREAAARCLTGS
jgi:enoyl-CoA hydratase/carnithine racemase